VSFQFGLFRSAGDALSLSYNRVSSSHSSKKTAECISVDFLLQTRRIKPADILSRFCENHPGSRATPIYTSESGKLSIEKSVKSVGREIKVFRAKQILSMKGKCSSFAPNIFRFVILILQALRGT